MKKKYDLQRLLLAFLLTLILPLPSLAQDETFLLKPFLFNPTGGSMSIDLITGRIAGEMSLAYKEKNSGQWTTPRGSIKNIKAPNTQVRWTLTGLSPLKSYLYRVLLDEKPVHSGSFRTGRPKGEEFSFALFTDAHIPAWLPISPKTIDRLGYFGKTPGILQRVARAISKDLPDFAITLGDNIDTHAFGFNPPFPDKATAIQGYLNFRGLLGDLPSNAPLFNVIGNWDGENGHLSAQKLSLARNVRMALFPGPGRSTYPQGGSGFGDYYAFTWGDALFVVLNVITYTKKVMDYNASPSDWTLGRPQLDWFKSVIEKEGFAYKFVFIHHPVGGKGANRKESAYGRGGARAALVGEQKLVHELMRDNSATAMFYGHDHVFTHQEMDGVHYLLPGSAGAPWKFGSDVTGYEDYDTSSGYALARVKKNKVSVVFKDANGRDIKIIYIKKKKTMRLARP